LDGDDVLDPEVIRVNVVVARVRERRGDLAGRERADDDSDDTAEPDDRAERERDIQDVCFDHETPHGFASL
jgi:hypothetical protein